MAKPTAVNETETALNAKVTDSIVQADTEVVGLAPSSASGNYYQGNSQALGLAALNATSAQQQNNINMQSSTPVEITNLYSIGTAPDSTGDSGIFDLAPRQRAKRIARVKLKKL